MYVYCPATTYIYNKKEQFKIIYQSILPNPIHVCIYTYIYIPPSIPLWFKNHISSLKQLYSIRTKFNTVLYYSLPPTRIISLNSISVSAKTQILSVTHHSQQTHSHILVQAEPKSWFLSPILSIKTKLQIPNQCTISSPSLTNHYCRFRSSLPPLPSSLSVAEQRQISPIPFSHSKLLH